MAVRSRSFGAEGLAWSQAPSDCDAVQSSNFPNPQENGTGVAGRGRECSGPGPALGHCFLLVFLGVVTALSSLLSASVLFGAELCSWLPGPAGLSLSAHSFIPSSVKPFLCARDPGSCQLVGIGFPKWLLAAWAGPQLLALCNPSYLPPNPFPLLTPLFTTSRQTRRFRVGPPPPHLLRPSRLPLLQMHGVIARYVHRA